MNYLLSQQPSKNSIQFSTVEFEKLTRVFSPQLDIQKRIQICLKLASDLSLKPYLISDQLTHLLLANVDNVFLDQRNTKEYREAVSKLIAHIASNCTISFNTIINDFFIRFHSEKVNKEIKTKLYHIIMSMIESKRLPPQSIQLILYKFQTYMDGMPLEDSHYLPQILDVFNLTADLYPMILSNSFQDIVDRIVGWLVDPKISQAVSSAILDTFKKFQPFWCQHLQFCIALLTQLIKDTQYENFVSDCEPRGTVRSVLLFKPTIGNTDRFPLKGIPLWKCSFSILKAIFHSVFPNSRSDSERGSLHSSSPSRRQNSNNSRKQSFTRSQSSRHSTERSLSVSKLSKQKANATNLIKTLKFTDFQPEYVTQLQHLSMWLVEIISKVGKKYRNPEWISLGSQLVRFLSKYYRATVPANLSISMLNFLTLELNWHIENFNTESSVKDVVGSIEKIFQTVECWSPSCSPLILDFFLDPFDSILLSKARFIGLKDSNSLILKTCCKVVGGLSFTNDQVGHKKSINNLMKEIEFIFEKVFKLPFEKNANIQKKKFVDLSKLKREEMCSLAMFNINLLTECAKWGIPLEKDLDCGEHIYRFFEEIFQLVEPIENLDQFSSRVKDTIFISIYAVCRSQSFFISPSLLEQNHASSGMLMEETIIEYCLQSHRQMLEKKKVLRFDYKILILNFFKEFFFNFYLQIKNSNIEPQFSRSLKKKISDCLNELILVLATWVDPYLRNFLANILLFVFENFSSLNVFSEYKLLSSHIQTLLDRTKDADENVVKTVLKILASLNHSATKLLLREYLKNGEEAVVENLIMRSNSYLSFKQKHFDAFMSSLGFVEILPLNSDEKYNLKIEKQGESFKMELGWLLGIFHACQSATSIKKNFDILTLQEQDLDNLIDRVEFSSDSLRFWGIWCSCQYLINNKLRSTFGDPRQTLEAIEYVLLVLIDTVSQKLPSKIEISDKQIFLLLNKLRNILHFINNLELLIQNAVLGAGLSVPQAPKMSMIFFSHNKGVCQDWLARIRRHLIFGGKLVGIENGFIIFHSLKFLNETLYLIKRGGLSDFDMLIENFHLVLFHMVVAYIELGDADCIVGLYSWLENSFHPILIQQDKKTYLSYHLGFLKVAVLLVTERVEQALTKLSSLISNSDVTVPNICLPLIAEMVAHYYKELNDYKSLENWTIHVEEKNFFSPEKFSAFKAPIHLWLKTFANFDNSGKSVNFDTFRQNLNFGLKEAILKLADENISKLSLFSDGRCEELSSDSIEILNCMLTANFLKLPDYFSYLFPLQVEMTLQTSLENTANATIQLDLLSNLVNLSTKLDGYSTGNLNRLYNVGGIVLKNVTGELEVEGRLLMDNFALNIAKFARKKQNLKLSQKLLGIVESISENSSILNIRKFVENGNYLFSTKKYEAALEIFTKAIDILEKSNFADQESTRALINKTCLKISQFYNINKKFDLKFLNFSPVENDTETLKPVEVITCKYLQKASKVCPLNSKPWYILANLYYRKGRKLVEDITSGKRTEILLLKQKIFNQPSNQIPESEISKLISSLFLKEIGEVDIVTNFSESLTSRLTVTFPHILPELVNEVSNTFKILEKEILYFYGLAVEGYLKFLNLFEIFDVTAANGDKAKDSKLSIATFRLIRILGKYGTRLKPHFENLDVIPSTLWEPVVMQLFARIDHNDEFAAKTVSKLILRIAESSPHLVVFPTVVGSLSKFSDAESISSYNNIFQLLYNKGHTKYVQEVKKMVIEFQRVTILWEEIWYHKLQAIRSDITKRIERFNLELKRLQNNASISEEIRKEVQKTDYFAILDPVLIHLRNVCKITIDLEPTTPHEIWFMETYGIKIRESILSLESTENFSIEISWTPFKEFLLELSNLVNKPRTIDIASVSPYLFNVNNSSIPLPGKSDNIVKIKAFSSLLTLATKTKPKKLSLLGNDGKEYSYLLKGLEDLHLDERIMQFISTVNTFLTTDKQFSKKKLSAATYSIIPFGDHFGMTQWINETNSFFSFYKSWQVIAKSTRVDAEGKSTEEIIRPAVQFSSKIAAAFQQQKLPKTLPRAKWPVDILKNVFLELEAETPPNLISTELRCSSPNPTVWLEKVNNFTKSNAVISMIGYVLGLGDRHLDNILMDSKTGNVIHIDFNICFEKGRKLRIAECVPFRLTQNMVKGFGLFGVEGTFRKSCENTLLAMRQNSEVLYTLLEAFISDPLIDWKNDIKEEQSRFEFEFNSELKLFSARLLEVSGFLTLNLESVIATLARFAEKCGVLATENAANENAVKRDNKLLFKKLEELRGWKSLHIQTYQHLKNPLNSQKPSQNFMLMPLQEYAGDALFSNTLNDINYLFNELNLTRVDNFNFIFENIHFYQSLINGNIDMLLKQDFSLKLIQSFDILRSGVKSANLFDFEKLFLSKKSDIDYFELHLQSIVNKKTSDLSDLANFLQACPAHLKDDEAQLRNQNIVTSLFSTNRQHNFVSATILNKLVEMGLLMSSIITTRADKIKISNRKIVVLRNVAVKVRGTSSSLPDTIHLSHVLILWLLQYLMMPDIASIFDDQKSFSGFYDYLNLSNGIFTFQLNFFNFIVPFQKKTQEMGESHMLMLITALDSIVKPNVHSDLFSIEHLVYVKKKLQLYESLKNRIYEERSEAKEIMVALDSIFLNIQELLFKISNQNPDMGNINLLIKYQIIEVKFKILKLCVAFSALNTSDPSGEWQLIVDFDDTTFDANKLFSSALRDLISCVKSFNTFCNNHLIMRPCVKKIKMLINSIPEIPYTEISNENFFEISNKVAASSTPLDENYKSFQLQLEDVVLNILQHSFLREGIIRMRQLELKMHQRVLGLMRYQHLHIAGESLLSDVNIQNYEVFKRLHSTLDLLANREALISQAETKLQCLRDNMESSNQNDAIKSLSVVVDKGIQVLNGEKEEVKKFLQICNSINHFESTRLLKSWAKILYNDFYTEVEKFKKHKVIKKLKNNPIISELFEYFKVKKDSLLEAIDAIELMFVKINLFIDHLGKLSKHLSKKDSIEIQEKLKLFTIIQNMKYMVLKLIPSTKVAFEALSNSSEKDPNCITLLLSCKFSHLEALSNKIRTTVHYILNAFKKGSLHDLTEENSLDFSDEQDYNFEDIFIKKNFLSEKSDVGMEKISNFEKEADILSDPQNSENSSVDQKEVRNSQAHERNVYASNMLKTVRSKLEGDVGRLNITDQVSLVINQATSVDNLSMMYEGWMAWI